MPRGAPAQAMLARAHLRFLQSTGTHPCDECRTACGSRAPSRVTAQRANRAATAKARVATCRCARRLRRKESSIMTSTMSSHRSSRLRVPQRSRRWRAARARAPARHDRYRRRASRLAATTSVLHSAERHRLPRLPDTFPRPLQRARPRPRACRARAARSVRASAVSLRIRVEQPA